jgi:hypothetical protein
MAAGAVWALQAVGALVRLCRLTPQGQCGAGGHVAPGVLLLLLLQLLRQWQIHAACSP